LQKTDRKEGSKMSKKLICVTMMMLALLISRAGAKSAKRTNKIVLLPVEQTNIPAGSKLSDKYLSSALLAQLTRLKGFELVQFAELSEAFDNQLVDDAVFELLITDDLKHTLAKLNALETKTAMLAEYCRIGKDAGIDYLVDVSIEQDLTQLRTTYKVIHTQTSRVANAKSFYDVPNDPLGVSDEIAKRIVRSLWQLQTFLTLTYITMGLPAII